MRRPRGGVTFFSCSARSGGVVSSRVQILRRCMSRLNASFGKGLMCLLSLHCSSCGVRGFYRSLGSVNL